MSCRKYVELDENFGSYFDNCDVGSQETQIWTKLTGKNAVKGFLGIVLHEKAI